MNFIATVNTPAHGHISVTFSENEKSVLDAWRDNVTIELSGKEKQQITNDIICNRRHKRVFEKAYVSTSGFGVFIFPVRSGRFCQSKLIEFATQIALWVKTESGFDFSEQEAVGEGCASPTMPSSAKTSPTKQESTRGVSRAGNT